MHNAALKELLTGPAAKRDAVAHLRGAVSVMAYHSFAGEVEASNTPTICRLIP
jgi:hypothetical protein